MRTPRAANRAFSRLLVRLRRLTIFHLALASIGSAATPLADMISTSAHAAHQIAVQVASILFMIPFGVSMAATVRTGHAVGRKDGPGIKRAGLVAMLFGIAITAALTLATVAARFDVAELLFGRSVPRAEATIRLAAELISVGASFFMTNAVQAITVGSLGGIPGCRFCSPASLIG